LLGDVSPELTFSTTYSGKIFDVPVRYNDDYETDTDAYRVDDPVRAGYIGGQ
jgi:hypothetical protein